MQNRATTQLSVTVRDHQFYQKLSHKEGQGKFQKPHFHFTSLPNFIRKDPSVVCYPCILQPSIRKGTKKYPFQSTQLHNLLLANVVTHHNHPRNWETGNPQRASASYSAVPQLVVEVVLVEEEEVEDREGEGKDNFPHCCSFPFSHRSSSY